MQPITLSKSSWHYRLQVWANYEGKEPTYWSICPYFWSTIFICLISPIIWLQRLGGNSNPKELNMFLRICRVLILAIFWGIVAILAIMLLATIAIVIWQKPLFALEVLGVILGLVFAMAGAILGIIWLKDTYDEKNEGVIKKPSIFKEYIKAKKAGICPRLLWKEDSEPVID
jgi:uncharacterized membrane protein